MYVIKIDKRKKSLFNDAVKECVKNNELWVNVSEDGYTEKKLAMQYYSRKEAEESITEDFEIVSRF